MGGNWYPVIVLVSSGLGAAAVARLWTSLTARLTVLAVALFGAVVVSFQVTGIAASALRRPVVAPHWVAVVSLVVAAALWLLARRVRSVSAEEPGSTDSQAAHASTGDRAAAVAVAVVALAFLSNAVVLGLSAPPRGWDVLSYHMPKAVSWLQSGNLGNYGSVAAFYPGNGEIAILVSLFTGTDRLAPLVQLPFALLSGVALYGIARQLGARARAAAVPAVVFMAAPMVLFQSGIAKDDLIVTGLVLAGSFMMLMALRGEDRWGGGEARDERRVRRDIALAGLAFGLALGVKYSVLGLVALTVPVVFVSQVAALRNRRESVPAGVARTAILRTLLFFAAVLVPALFWFVQNWIVAGHPFEPLSGDMVARAFYRHDASYVSHSAAWWLFPWTDRAVEGSYSASAGFGAAFAALAPPAAALAVWRLVRRRGPSHKRLRVATLVALVALAAASWWFGGHHLPRFLLPAVGLACAPTALLFDRTSRWARAGLVAVLSVAVVFSLAESLRIVYGSDDLVSSQKGFVGKAEYYNMPALIYELPPGTRILLLNVPGYDVFRTFKYPLVGDLPGNEVVMMGDLGFETDLMTEGPVAGHAGLVREGVEYVFLRTLALPPGPTVFDSYPGLYRKVLDTVEEPYPWHKKGFLPTPGDGLDLRAPAVTRIYEVLAG
jgi:4-amino-4-deoxy-L-arabinose transferase-like glycosyltransferase